MAGWTTLGELATRLTRPEVLDACEMLDALEEAQAVQEERARMRSGGAR